MKLYVVRFLILIFFGASLVSCIETGSDAEDFSIVIPPGDQVQFSTDEFLDHSDDNYAVVVRKVGDTNQSLQTLLEVTPDEGERLDEGVVHKKIVPKGSSLDGFLILEVEMEYHDTHFYGFIFDSETTVKPDFYSSLTYDLLSNYPGRSIKSYSKAEILKIQSTIKQIVLDRMDFFEIDFTVKMDLLYKFMKNTLSSNYAFLSMLEADHNVDFDYDLAGNIAMSPFPFGAANTPPVLNEQASTRPGLRIVQEQQEGRLKAVALDPDGDLVFYVWTFEGAFHDAGTSSFSWTPDYTGHRPTTYPVSAIVSDGGQILQVDWEFQVLDVNRPPEITVVCTDNTVIENDEYRCQFSASDPDGTTNYTWVLGGSGHYGPSTLNGQAPGTTVTGDNVEIVFTPNNADGKRRSATFELSLNDGSGGADILLHTIAVTDLNDPPVLLGDIVATNPLHMVPREWDSCLNKDVYGLADDSAPSNGAFTFSVELEDPDNVAGASPKDNISLRIVGAGTQNITETNRVEDNVNNKVTYHYQWKPDHNTRIVDINFIITDDHGGVAPVVIKNLVAQDINQRSCMGWNTNAWYWWLDEGIRTFRRYPHWTKDGDGDIPQVVREDTDVNVLPFTTNYYNNQPVILSRKFDDIGLTRKTKFSYKWQGNRVYAVSKYSGVLKLERSVVGASSNTVPKGFQLNLVEASTGHFVEFETAYDVTVAEDDQEVYVPIIAINREVPANALSVIADPLSDGTITTSHAAVSSDFLWVTLTRGPGTTDLDVMIPEDTRFTNAPGNTSFEFRVAGDFFMASGVSSVTVPTYRYKRSFPAGSAINHALGDPSITLSLPTSPRDHIGFSLAPYKNWVQYEQKFIANDGAQTLVGEIGQINGPLGDPATTLTVTNSNSFYEFGEVTFERSLSNSGSNLTIPAGTSLEALSLVVPLGLPNGKRYLTEEEVVIPAGLQTVTAKVQRQLERSPNHQVVRYRFRDYNYRPLLHNDNLNIVLQEGTELLNYKIIMKDDTNQYLAKDPSDRYIFTNLPQAIVPTGQVNFCRNEVSSYAESSNPATCIPCNTLQSGIKYHGSRICHVNYAPDTADTAETYIMKIEVNDNGYGYPSGSTKTILPMNISVIEDNEPPQLTDENGTPIAGGETLANPIVVSQKFIENIPGLFKVHASDGDKTLELKKVAFEITEAYDVSQGNAVIPVPERIEAVILEQNYDVSGVGSQTEGGIKWTPDDEDIKKYSGAGGIIVKLKIFDNILQPDSSLFIERFFKLEVENVNNIPSFNNLSDTLEPQVNTYFSQVITVVDEDEATPLFGSFQTELNLCKDKFGNAMPHDGLNEVGDPTSPALDDPLETDPVNCHAHSSLWGHKYTQFDPDYSGNSAVAECRLISGSDNDLNQDLAVPKFSRVNGPYFIDGKIAYDYKLEWCPQEGQIADFGVDIVLTDNGDVDRLNNALDLKYGAISLQVNVISPVFFESPKLSLQEIAGRVPAEYSMQPDHHMVQTTNRGGVDQFTYPLLISNSKGNPIEVQILDAPRACEVANGVCVESDENNESFTLTWHPKYPDDITTTDPATWHRIELRVLDTVTNEEDIVHFFLQVNPAGSNLNRPSIDSFLPVAANQTMNELDLLTLSVDVTDADAFPAPVLHYSWFVNDILVYDRSNTFEYVPDKIQGGIDVDGTGPLAKGEHKIKVVVSDGNFRETQEWTVKVNNTYLVPFEIFDLVSARKQVDNVTVTDVDWSLELPHEQTLYGAGGTEFFMNHVMISGSYKVGVVKKNFLWDLKLFEGQVTQEPVGSPWSLYENLPWRDGDRTQRLSYYYTGSSLNFLAGALSDRDGPYTTTQDAVKLSGNMSNISTPLAGGFKCVGTCASQLYLGPGGYGHRLSKTWGSYLFWVDDTGKELKFDYNAGNLLTVTDFFNYDADGSDDSILGLEVSDSLKRLYIATRDNSNGKSYVHIYDLSPLGTKTSDSGSAVPSLVGRMTLSLPAPYTSVSAGPTDIVFEESSNTGYVFLANVGGVFYFNDNGTGLPSTSDANYLGLDKISPSPTDLPSSGYRLFYNTKDDLLMGISREGSQIFTVNPAYGNNVSVHSYPAAMDSVMNFKETGTSLIINRTLNKIFELK